MEDTELLQQFRINAMHGHDVGVWICEASGLSLSPVLFMQAVCPHPPPRPLLVKWKSAAAPPRAFRKEGVLPLVYCECGRIPPWPYHLHLFTPQAPIAEDLEHESGLPHWSIAVPVIGIIVIFNERYDRPPSVLSWSRLVNRSKSPQPETNRSLSWARDQHLPYVVAALGYDEMDSTVQQFRSRYDLSADIPVLFGPTPADARQRGAQGDQSSGMFSSMFERRKVTLDGDYARAVLGKLYQLAERSK
jgi:hypothetical protein